MKLKDMWKPKVDGVDDVLAEDINNMANAIIENEKQVDEGFERIDELEKSMANYDKADLLSLSLIKTHEGLLPQSGSIWNVSEDKYLHILIPISGGEEIVLKGVLSPYTRWGVVRTYSEPKNGDTIDFSTQDGYTTTKVTGQTEFTGTLPDDGRYLIIIVKYGTSETIPEKLEINGVDYTITIRKMLSNIVDFVDDTLETSLKGVVKLDDVKNISWEVGTFTQNIGQVSTNTASKTRLRTPMLYYDKDVKVVSIDSGFYYRLVIYNEDLTVKSVGAYIQNETVVPKNTLFRITVGTTSSGGSDDISTINGKDVISVHDDRAYNAIYGKGVNWCAMGDSITQGYVSTGANTSYISKTEHWAYKLASIKGYTLDNKGIGGSGYVFDNTGKEDAAWRIVKDIDFKNYDLVTLAYGVNDWKGNKSLGTFDDNITAPTTIIAGMRATIESIIASNPFCKIVVITPLNCIGYNFDFGDESTNYALQGKTFASGTLEDVYNGIKSVCEYYGIEYIDMTHASIVNRKNITSCLLDGVHPSADAHTVMARELAGKINFM